MTCLCRVKRFCIFSVVSVGKWFSPDLHLHEMEMHSLISKLNLAVWTIREDCKPCQHFNTDAEFSFHKCMVQSQSSSMQKKCCNDDNYPLNVKTDSDLQKRRCSGTFRLAGCCLIKSKA